jgi:hypothetical protein
LQKAVCSSYYLAEGCFDVKEEESIPINIYKGKLICKKPMPPKYTMNNMVIPALKDYHCPEGEKMCGRAIYKYYKTCIP